MLKSKKAFVLIETIVVISILCVILIMLYASYNKILIDVKSKSLYNNTEYIYKTNVIRNYLEPKVNVLNKLNGNNYVVHCSNTLLTAPNCDTSIDGYDLFNFLGVNAIYFSIWNINSSSISNFLSLEATTQSYIKTIDTKSLNGVYRIIVMYKDENNDTEKDVYQYATLRFGSRG